MLNILKLCTLVIIIAVLGGCSHCEPPQAVSTHTELDMQIGVDLAALTTVPIGEVAAKFKSSVDETFKQTPGADTLDIMLYRICVTAERHAGTITPEVELAMQQEAYKAWLKYVRGLERIALEKVKAGLEGQPLGPPAVVSSANVPDDVADKVKRAVDAYLALSRR